MPGHNIIVVEFLPATPFVAFPASGLAGAERT